MQKELFHVSLVALPDVLTGSLLGSLDLFSSVGKDWSGMTEKREPTTALFTAEIVSTSRDPIACFAEISIFPHQSIFDLQHTDIVYLPSIAEMPKEPLDLQYQEMFAWIWKMYQQGATICAACSGIMMMAETGLLDDREATIHTAYIETFRSRYPKVILCPNQVLVQSGQEQKLVTTGGDCTWQDLVLYLISRYAGTEAAMQTAKVFLIKWYLDPQMLSCAGFQANFQHSDAMIRVAQKWLIYNAYQPNAILGASQVAGLASQTFNRRFKKATGCTPIAYIQNLRIEGAKVKLETTENSVDDIGVAVGYNDSSSFRLLFKRITGLTPSCYRRKFKLIK
jgi:transcriptional regulator GlxA family with amidase domain